VFKSTFKKNLLLGFGFFVGDFASEVGLGHLASSLGPEPKPLDGSISLKFFSRN